MLGSCACLFFARACFFLIEVEGTEGQTRQWKKQGANQDGVGDYGLGPMVIYDFRAQLKHKRRCIWARDRGY